MFERFTERARQVVVLAQEEARTLKHNYIGTEHILLGLLREEEGLAARVLESLDITVERVRETFSRPLTMEGILLTMYDDRTNLARQVADDLRDFFGNEVFTTVIPRSIRHAEAPSYGKPILMYDPRSKGAESYIKLAKEILENERSGRQATQSAG